MKSNLERVEMISNTMEEVENRIKQGLQHETYQIKGWREKNLSRPIINIECEFLMYRIENSRTFRQQLRYIHNNNLPDNFFSNPELPEVQKAQESILLDLIHSSSSGQDFIDDLSKSGQLDPAIITYEGYIVNGNRRVAALKETGKRFIDCVVLPKNATKKDIYALEHLLQISKDFKEEYHWVNELNNFYQGIYDKSLDYDESQMIKTFRISKQDLETKLRMMNLVNEYLNWKGIPQQYDYEKLDNAEEVFIQLEKGIKKNRDAASRQEMMHAVFHLVETPPSKGRIYAVVVSLIKNWEAIYNRALREQQKNPTITQQQETKNPIDNQLSVFVEGAETHLEIFAHPDDSNEVAKMLYEIVADIKAETDEQSEAEAVYDGVSSALRELLGLIVTNKSTKLEAAKNKILQIIEVSQSLLRQIDKNE